MSVKVIFVVIVAAIIIEQLKLVLTINRCYIIQNQINTVIVKCVISRSTLYRDYMKLSVHFILMTIHV